MEKYKENVEAVQKYNRDRHYGRKTIRTYSECFEDLGSHLSANGLPYTHETAVEWLDRVKEGISDGKFSIYKAAIAKLDDCYATGTVRGFHYDRLKTTEGRLSPAFQCVVRGVAETLSGLADATITNKRFRCASILLAIQENRHHAEVPEIGYPDLLWLEGVFKTQTYHMRTSGHEALDLLLNFLYGQGLVPYGFTLFVSGVAFRDDIYWNSAGTGKMAEMRESQEEAGDALPLDGYLEIRDTLVRSHREQGFSAGAVCQLSRIADLFYLFMDINGLRYTPEVGHLWLDSVEPRIPAAAYRHHRRIILLVGQSYRETGWSLETRFVSRATVFGKLPQWCKPTVLEFLERKRNEGLAKSSLDMYRSSICRFCLFVSGKGVASFPQLNPAVIKEFNLADKHRTPEGKNAYNSRIRKFLDYLGECGLVENRHLFLALPSVCSARETIVITLTREERERLSALFSKDDRTLTLRRKAMLQLGLYMGMRGIDIVGLLLDEIDWDNACVRFVQEKTGYGIELPMPVDVANALYRYLMEERPDSGSRHVFLSENAPYRQVTRHCCGQALAAALPGRDVPGSGFHVTRKSFATMMLRNNATVQEVTDALGHHGNANVHKYLSLDDERMRGCGFSLASHGMAWEGGMFHA